MRETAFELDDGFAEFVPELLLLGPSRSTSVRSHRLVIVGRLDQTIDARRVHE